MYIIGILSAQFYVATLLAALVSYWGFYLTLPFLLANVSVDSGPIPLLRQHNYAVDDGSYK